VKLGILPAPAARSAAARHPDDGSGEDDDQCTLIPAEKAKELGVIDEDRAGGLAQSAVSFAKKWLEEKKGRCLASAT